MAEYGSDIIIDMLKSLGIKYAALNPGASFRGIHDSLVNYNHNKNPEIIVCCHEEIAVSRGPRLCQGHRRAHGRHRA